MVDTEQGLVRSVAWSELMPWLRLIRVFRVSISARVLLLSALATAITFSGWAVCYRLFRADPAAVAWMGEAADCPWMVVDRMVPNEPALPWDRPEPGQDAVSGQAELAAPRDAFFGSWWVLVQPFWQSLDLQRGPTGLACLALCGLWSLATWAFFGGAITRIAAVELSCEERIGWMAALRYACRKWLSYFSAPLMPLLLGVALPAIPVVLLGLLLAWDFGVLLVAIVWPLALLAGLIMAVVSLGLLFGWPLMFATISTEGTDSFDALSRSYAYVFQRPLHYLLYAVLAALLGTLCWLLVSNFAAAVVGMAYWAASWGAGADRIVQIISGSGEPAMSSVGKTGVFLVHLWVGAVKLLAAGFLYGFFFTAATAIYLLLRRDVDATELDEVFLDEDESEQAYGLPPLVADDTGVPDVDDQQADIEPKSGAEQQPPSGD